MRKILKEYHQVYIFKSLFFIILISTTLISLSCYIQHIVDNTSTLLCRYYGLHRVKLPHGKKIHFVVMSNVFPPSKDIHETYDLKVNNKSGKANIYFIYIFLTNTLFYCCFRVPPWVVFYHKRKSWRILTLSWRIWTGKRANANFN